MSPQLPAITVMRCAVTQSVDIFTFFTTIVRKNNGHPRTKVNLRISVSQVKILIRFNENLRNISKKMLRSFQATQFTAVLISNTASDGD